MICVIADLTLHPGTGGEFFAAARRMIDATRAEEGCIRYDLMQDIDNPARVTFVEEWQSREALAAHFEAAHMTEWRAASSPHLAARAVKILHVGEVETV